MWDSVKLAGNPPTQAPPPLREIAARRASRPVIDRDRAEDEAWSQRSSAGRRAAIHDVGHRCPCGNPDVVTTEPRLPNGTPFPTTYYLTCPRAASLIGTLEGSA